MSNLANFKDRFIDEKDTARDKHLKLVWRKKAEHEGGEGEELLRLDWASGLAHAWRQSQQDENGLNWRLPTIEELSSLVEIDGKGRLQYPDWLPAGEKELIYWSGSPDAEDSGRAWLVVFVFGYVFRYRRDNQYCVRLVRGV